jgi:hypothetical protein
MPARVRLAKGASGLKGQAAQKAAKRRWYEKNREKAIASAAAWRQAHPERAAAQRRKAGQKWDREKRLAHEERKHLDREWMFQLAQSGLVIATAEDLKQPPRVRFAHRGRNYFDDNRSAEQVLADWKRAHPDAHPDE